jgi:aminopeptidase YwaD
LETLSNNIKKGFLFLLTVGLVLPTLAQKPRFGEKKIARNIEKHIKYLASDELEGRGTGSAGEELSAKYVEKYFIKYGLEPKGDNNTYRQYIDIPSLRIAQTNTSLSIDDEVQTLFANFYPLSPSANNGKYEGIAINVGHGITDSGLDQDDYKDLNVKGKAVLIKVELPGVNHPHSKFAGWSGVERRAQYAKSKGAAAVLYYTGKKDNYPSGELAKSTKNIGIPVFFVAQNLDKKATVKVSLTSDILLLSKSASNVVGFIDRGAQHTVVVGAHHDHLGYGENGGSLAEKDGQIHNGADDNASGVAALIELARVVKKKKRRYKNNNYIFVAFTAEELGLIGSKHFVEKQEPIDLMNYMVNMDMIGHLDSTSKTLVINGVGTSPLWKEKLEKIRFNQKKIAKIKTTESGIGASDHTSFYLQGVPSVHFFTGQHQYYHKPSDDFEIVNVNGTAFVTCYIAKYLKLMDKHKGKIAFTETKNEDQTSRRKFSVTLGVMPDYVFDGEGMRIDGVKEGKPASKAGIVKGDIVISINGNPIANMKDYMKMLTQLQPGDKVPVVVKRGNETKEVIVQF